MAENENSSALSINDSMLTPYQIDNLFTEEETGLDNSPDENNDSGKEGKYNNAEDSEINVSDLFSPESVGNEDDNEEEGDAAVRGAGSSPKDKTFYSSIARAFINDGIFLDLDPKLADGIRNEIDFGNFINNEINRRAGQNVQRLNNALSAGMAPDDIKKYETTLSYLNGISGDQLRDESDAGVAIRQQLLYNDFINRGFNDRRAQREVNNAFKNGTDIDDATEALNTLKNYYSEEYESSLRDAENRKKQVGIQNQQYQRDLVNSIMNQSDFVGGLKISDKFKREMADNLVKPIWQDVSTGRKYSAIDVYRQRNPVDFSKNVSLFFTLTEGFTNIDKLFSGSVKERVKSSLKELEGKLNTTRRTSDGNLEYMAGASAKKNGGLLESADWDIDI